MQPIIGCEMYVAPGDRRDKQRVVSGDDFETGGNFHLILLAMNEQGYRNLCRLVTLGYTEGFYYKPRIDKELLRELNGGPDRAVGLPGERGESGARDRLASIAPAT